MSCPLSTQTPLRSGAAGAGDSLGCGDGVRSGGTTWMVDDGLACAPGVGLAAAGVGVASPQVGGPSVGEPSGAMICTSSGILASCPVQETNSPHGDRIAQCSKPLVNIGLFALAS